jgi:hypothetical protein
MGEERGRKKRGEQKGMAIGPWGSIAGGAVTRPAGRSPAGGGDGDAFTAHGCA